MSRVCVLDLSHHDFVFFSIDVKEVDIFFQDTRLFKRSADIYDYQAMIFIYERFVCIVAVMILFIVPLQWI